MDRDNSNWGKWVERIKWGRNWDAEEVERDRQMNMNKPEY